MVDQLSKGPERERRDPLVTVAIALVAVALVAALVHQLGSGDKPTAVPTPAATTLSLAPPTLPTDLAPSRAPIVYSPAAPDPADHITPLLVGVPSSGPLQARLVVGGAQLIGFGDGSLPTGRVPVPDGEMIGQLLAVPSGLVAMVSQNQNRALTPGPYSKAYFVPKVGPARFLGDVDWVVVAHDGRSVFAERYGQDGAKNQVLQIDLAGKVLARHSLDGSLSVQADTAVGLLLQRNPQDSTAPSVDVVDRRTFAVRQHLDRSGYLIGASATQAAWVDAQCEHSCPVVVANLVTGARHVLKPARHAGVGFVSFSPDGKRAALAYYGQHSGSSGVASAGFVEVFDLATGHRHQVPGVATDVKQSADLAWTPDGRWLAIAVVITDQDVRKVGLWPAAGGPVRLVGSVPGTANGGSLIAL